MLPPLAALVAAYLLSFRAKKPESQEQGKYHVLPADLRIQEQGRSKETENSQDGATGRPMDRAGFERAGRGPREEAASMKPGRRRRPRAKRASSAGSRRDRNGIRGETPRISD